MRYVALTVLTSAALASGQTVYQDLDEATARINRLAGKPFGKLIDPVTGYHQSDTLIFRDTETGHEIQSLTMERCVEIANIERRMVWSSDGSAFSLQGNRAFRDSSGILRQESWYEHNYIYNADLTHRRRMYVNLGGQIRSMSDKFDAWDHQRPRTLYYATDNKLYRVSVGDGPLDNAAEAIYTFPDSTRRFIQNIGNNNLMLIQDWNATSPTQTPKPRFYSIDLNKDPSDPNFARSHTFDYGGITGVTGHDPVAEFAFHEIEVDTGTDPMVHWNYGSMTSAGERVYFGVPADDLSGPPVVVGGDGYDGWGQYRSHKDTNVDGVDAYFGGRIYEPEVYGEWGLWVAAPDGSRPIYTGARVGGGHVTWAGKDPDIWHAHIYNGTSSWIDPYFKDSIVRGDAAGGTPTVIARPYDNRRGGPAGGYESIPRPTQSPDATKVLFHSSMLMPSDNYTGSFIVVSHGPRAPGTVAIAAGRLSFTPHAVNNEVQSYLVYKEVAGEWTHFLAVDPIDAGCDVDADGVYMVTALEHSGLESSVSSPTVAVDGSTGGTITDFDTDAPIHPTKLTVTPEDAGEYRLRWAASPSVDVRYYNLYFSDADDPDAVQQRRFASPPANATEYLDWLAPLSGDAFYAITAVDRQGNESVRSLWTPTAGDFTRDGVVDADDISLLLAGVGGDPELLDLVPDEVIDSADVDELILDILGSQYGDANLDLTVDVFDLAALATHYGRSDRNWAAGDFTGDGVVNVFDLAVLAANYGKGAGGAPIPEPATIALLTLGAALLTRRKRR